jgi:thiol:disulfide interchange protein DsbA
MNRGFVIAGALAAAAAVAIVSVRACAAVPAAESYAWESGVNYQVLGRPQTTPVPKGKIEVAEVFWYGCGHCYALDPTLESWKQKKPAYIEFVRIPVIWGPTHMQHARLYYTMLALHRADLQCEDLRHHPQGREHARRRDGRAGARPASRLLPEIRYHRSEFQCGLRFCRGPAEPEASGVAHRKVRSCQRSTIIVNGTYSTSVSQAGDETRLLALINDLAAREKGR